MPKLSATVTATTTVTTTVTLSATARQMLKARLQEHTDLAAQIKERKARQDRIQAEVADLFAREGQDDALNAGTDVDGIPVKRVGGVTRTLDKDALMRAVELTAAELDAFYDEKPRKTHIRIGKERDHDG